MPGVSMYIQPISRTMEHNVNAIVNDFVGGKSNQDLSPHKSAASAAAGQMLTLPSQNTAATTRSNSNVGERVDSTPTSTSGSAAPSTNTDGSNKDTDPTIYDDYDSGQSSGLRITEHPWTSIFDIELQFHGRNRADDTEFAFSPHQFTKLVIEQKFIDNAADHISVVVTLAPNEALLLLDNYRNLRAHVMIRRMDQQTETVDREDPVLDRDYIVALKDKELRKRISKQALIPNEYLAEDRTHHEQMFDNIELQLIADDEYNLGMERFHFMLTHVKVKDAILYGVKQMSNEIKQVSMVEPDNKKIYMNLVVPPQQNIKSFLEFMQSRYGVYSRGCNFYFHDGILYIYPPYKRDESDTCSETTHFYCTGDGSFMGCKHYHAKDQNNMYHIVINHTPIIKELVDSGVGRYGNVLRIQRADLLIDRLSTIGEGSGAENARMGLGKIEVGKTNTIKFMWESPEEVDYGIINNPTTEEFICTSSVYKYQSQLMSYRGTLCAFEWTNAEPYFIRPGYAVKWHIDGERDTYDPDVTQYRDTAEYKTYNGICDMVIYTFMPAANPQATHYPFTCRANIVLNLEYLPGKRVKDPADIIDLNSDEEPFVETPPPVGEGADHTPKKRGYAAEVPTVDPKKNLALKSFMNNVQVGIQKVRQLIWPNGMVTNQPMNSEIPKTKTPEEVAKDYFSLMGSK